MYRIPGRAAVIAARPLTLTIASAVALTGLLAAPAPASLAASPPGTHATRPAPGRLPGSLARTGRTPASQAKAGQAAGAVTGVLRGFGAQPAGFCVTAAGAAGHAVAKAGPDGRYVLSGLRQGRYSLTAGGCAGPTGAPSLGTILSSRLGSVLVRAGRIDTAPAGTAISLGSGSLGDSSGRAISPQTARPEAGAKTGSISGLVTSAGKKLAGICAAAISLHTDQFRTTVTGKTGRYQIRQLTPGKFIVEFFGGLKRCPDSGNWLPQLYPNRTGASGGRFTTVPVSAGKDTKGINAAMKVGGQVAGTVRTQAGTPVAGACVIATGTAGKHQFAETTASSFASGRYVLHGIFPGKYKVLFSLGCGSKRNLNLAGQWWPKASTSAGATRLTITARQHFTGINASLPPGAIVTGTVRAKTATSRPLPGICVTAFGFGQSPFAPEVVTGKDGRFKLIGLSTGGYSFDFDPSCQSAHGLNFLSLQVNHHVTAGRTLTGFNVLLRPASGLKGVVTDTAGHRVPGVCVVVDDDNLDQAVTRPDGSYSLKGIPAGHHEVQFAGGCGSKGSLAPQFWDNQGNEQAATPVVFAAERFTRSIDAVMQPGGTVAGVVTDSAGHPLRGICAQAAVSNDDDDDVSGEFESEPQSNAAGHYRITNLSPGAYLVSVGCDEGPFATTWFPAAPDSTQASLISVPAGHATTVAPIRLKHAGTIAGTVTDSTGKPKSQVCVEAADFKTRTFIDTGSLDGFTGRKGTYRLTGLSPGRYLIQFVDCGDRTPLAEQWFGNKAAKSSGSPVTVRPGKKTTGINAALKVGGTVSGRVTTPSGQPAARICVEAVSLANFFGQEAVTNKSGSYTISGLASGHYAISFSPCGRTATDAAILPSVTVAVGKAIKGANVKLAPTGSITGTLRNSEGAKGNGDVCVFAVPAGSGSNVNAEIVAQATTATGGNGQYTIRGVIPGSYKVSFNDAACNFSEGPPAFTAQWFSGKFTQAAAEKVTVQAGKTTAGIDADLKPFGSITGSVRTAASAGVAGECVTAVPQDAGFDPATFQPAVTPEIAITSSTGGYSIASLAPGPYKIKFSAGCGASGHPTQWWDGAGSAAKATIINVVPATVIAGINATLQK